MRTRPAFPVRTGLGFLFLFLAQALAVPTTAHAHGDTVKVVVTGQREGHVTTEITWENDGDAIEEAVAATVNSTSPDGSRTMGPWRLVRDAGTRTGWTTAEVLPPGNWKVTVDVGFPSLGHGEKEIAVPVVDPAPSAATPSAAAPSAPSTAPVPPVSSAAPSPGQAQSPSPASGPSAAPAGEDEDSTVWWTTAGVAVIALAGAAAGVLLRRARARRR
ncbi:MULTISPECIES: hypothetical protein [unclassified Streptomyces]|uniref:Uncharacterized protein n=1 Tax=Streptomyces sp. R33 TaxID=3238629 RepID=A0AB39XYA3_9ACTN|nr:MULTISPECIES: hypothetical protein [unclassified Streptomyces]TDU74331.1 hypothetical protein EDD91_0971 [Streptomyces sp. KS 21]THA40165.1 hypothetical protein E6W17_07730 [Streptomyces sp. A1547]